VIEIQLETEQSLELEASHTRLPAGMAGVYGRDVCGWNAELRGFVFGEVTSDFPH
jgi:hypothetical protein